MNENDRQTRRMELGLLYARCPRGAEASEAVDIDLEDTKDIPTLLFLAAVRDLRKNLKWPETPGPGDIRVRAQELLRRQRIADRQERRAQELAEVYQEAMEPAEALQLLADLKAEGEPEGQGDKIAHRLRCHVLERVVARDRSLLLDTGDIA